MRHPSPAHDLNNLLAKIMGSAELALDHPMGEEPRGELHRILAFVENGMEMVRTLDAAENVGSGRL